MAADPARGLERVDFHCFLFVRDGTYEHSIDFEAYSCTAGSCLTIAPGQVHRFGPPGRWTGAMLIVDAHYAPAESIRLPTHVTADDAAADAIAELLDRMRADSAAATGREHLHRLLLAQVSVLGARLALAAANTTGSPSSASASSADLVRAYERAIDEHFRTRHQVSDYAQHLGCTAKSLRRACQAARGSAAKRVIVERIILEAKRSLALSSDPVQRIGEQLGFDDATNFTKFFRRETGVTPSSFRSSVRTSGDLGPRRTPPPRQ